MTHMHAHSVMIQKNLVKVKWCRVLLCIIFWPLTLFNSLVNYYTKLSKLIDSRDTDETDDSTVDEFKSFKSESGPGK